MKKQTLRDINGLAERVENETRLMAFDEIGLEINYLSKLFPKEAEAKIKKSIEEYCKGVVDEKGVLFLSPRLGYVVVDYLHEGEISVPKDHRISSFKYHLMFNHIASKNQWVEGERQRNHCCAFMSHDRELTYWLRKHPKYGIDFFDYKTISEILQPKNPKLLITKESMPLFSQSYNDKNQSHLEQSLIGYTDKKSKKTIKQQKKEVESKPLYTVIPRLESIIKFGKDNASAHQQNNINELSKILHKKNIALNKFIAEGKKKKVKKSKKK